MKKFINDHQWLGILFLIVSALAGCASVPVEPPVSKAPICEAIGPKIKFNSHNKDSAYHAGPKLAPRLSHQNDVHDNLNCKDE